MTGPFSEGKVKTNRNGEGEEGGGVEEEEVEEQMKNPSSAAVIRCRVFGRGSLHSCTVASHFRWRVWMGLIIAPRRSLY